jgi:rubrerythrin
MKEKEKRFSLEISDVIEPEQEAAVIEAVKEYVKKNHDELREYFKSTDTIEVGGLGESEARSLLQRLERCKVTTSLRGPGAGRGDAADSGERASVTCPQCGTRLESLDWRCPECFYEFPEYDYRDEVE